MPALLFTVLHPARVGAAELPVHALRVSGCHDREGMRGARATRPRISHSRVWHDRVLSPDHLEDPEKVHIGYVHQRR